MKEQAQSQSDKHPWKALQQGYHSEPISRANSLRKARLESLRNADSEKKKRSPNWTDSIVSNILANLRVHISNIHIRFEDDATSVPRAVSSSIVDCALGLTIASFSLESSEEASKKPLRRKSDTLAPRRADKTARLVDVAMYWNTQALSWGNMSAAALATAMKGSVARVF